MQHKELLSLACYQIKTQFGTSKQAPQFVAQALETVRGNQRFAIDKITLERREHLLIRDFQRIQHEKSTQKKMLRGQERHQRLGISQVGENLGA